MDILLNDIEEGYLGGVVLYEKNISSQNSWISLKGLNMSLQNRAEIPLFIAIDQEGGRVNRLKSKYGFLSSKRWLSALSKSLLNEKGFQYP